MIVSSRASQAAGPFKPSTRCGEVYGSIAIIAFDDGLPSSKVYVCIRVCIRVCVLPYLVLCRLQKPSSSRRARGASEQARYLHLGASFLCPVVGGCVL